MRCLAPGELLGLAAGAEGHAEACLQRGGKRAAGRQRSVPRVPLRTGSRTRPGTRRPRQDSNTPADPPKLARPPDAQ